MRIKLVTLLLAWWNKFALMFRQDFSAARFLTHCAPSARLEAERKFQPGKDRESPCARMRSRLEWSGLHKKNTTRTEIYVVQKSVFSSAEKNIRQKLWTFSYRICPSKWVDKWNLAVQNVQGKCPERLLRWSKRLPWIGAKAASGMAWWHRGEGGNGPWSNNVKADNNNHSDLTPEGCSIFPPLWPKNNRRGKRWCKTSISLFLALTS